MTLRRRIDELAALADVLVASVIDPNRELVRAAKHLVRRRQDRCAGRCEVCEQQIASAWNRCMKYRRLQRVKSSFVPWIGTVVAAMEVDRG